jgi:hypothetical protein
LIVSSKLGFGEAQPRCRSLPAPRYSRPLWPRVPGLLALNLPSPLEQAASREVPFQALAYGHCGKKFAEKVPGEVSHSPAPGAVTLTLVYETEIKTKSWPGGHEKVLGGGGGSTVREPVIWPFLPDVNVPDAVTLPDTDTLLAALGHCCPWFRQP